MLSSLERLISWSKVAVMVVAVILMLSLSWVFIESAWTLRVARSKLDQKADSLITRVLDRFEPSAKNIDDIILNQKYLSFHLKDAGLSLFTEVFIEDMHKYARVQAASVLATSNNSRKLADNLNETVKELRPKISSNLEESEKLITSLSKVLNQAEFQLKQNGDAAKETILAGKQTLEELSSFTATTKTEVVLLLKEATKTTQGISVITNDPELASVIRNANLNLANLAVVSDALGKVAKDFAYGTPPKNKLDKFLIRPFKYAVRLFAGATQLLVLIERF